MREGGDYPVVAQVPDAAAEQSTFTTLKRPHCIRHVEVHSCLLQAVAQRPLPKNPQIGQFVLSSGLVSVSSTSCSPVVARNSSYSAVTSTLISPVAAMPDASSRARIAQRIPDIFSLKKCYQAM